MKAWLPLALTLPLLLTAGCHAEVHSAPTLWTHDTDAAWSAMQERLVGKWKATTPENRTITTEYRLVSRGTALVETFTSASGKETISVYHHDGGTLMLTHYCAQGNQARLKATDATTDKVVFSFLDVTNVASDQGVMHKLTFSFRPDGFDQESVYQEPNNKLDSTTLHFVRDGER